MIILGHIALLALSIGIVWFFGGRIVDAVNRVAKRLHQSRFIVAFFVLGFITSISELSVMINATLARTPQVSAGNLVGASVVIFLFIIPFLAIASRGGLTLKHSLSPSHLIAAIVTILLPVVFLADGIATPNEGIICFSAYIALLYVMRPTKSFEYPSATDETGVRVSWVAETFKDLGTIIVSGLIIFFSAGILVDEANFFSSLLQIPGSFIGLIVLSVGTNIPELVVALRAALQRHSDIAFGNYIGSGMTNTAIFGLLPLLNGRFMIDGTEFIISSLVLVAGLIVFYFFAQSDKRITRGEGVFLMTLYAIFITLQTILVVG